MVLALLLGCAPPPCDGPCVGVTLNLHVEGWRDRLDDDRLAHAHAVDRMLAILEQYGAVATLDLDSAFLDETAEDGDSWMLDWQARGHALGVHTQAGGQGADVDATLTRLHLDRAAAETLGFEPVHVSGACGPVDWIGAVQAAGFTAATGLTAWCLTSYDDEDLPSEWADVRWCTSPAECHDPAPADPEHAVHPWRSDSSSSWLEASDEGLLLVAGLGALRCLDEYHRGEATTGCPYDEADNDAAMAHLSACLAAADGSHPEACGLTWSIGDEADPFLLRELLLAIGVAVDAGQLRWTTIPEIVAAAS